MHSATRPGKPFLDPTNRWNNWKQTSWILSRLQPDRLTSADPIPAVHSLYVCQKGRTGCCNLSECQKDFDRVFKQRLLQKLNTHKWKGKYHHRMKTSFCFWNRAKWKLVIGFEEPCSRSFKVVYWFCNSILGRIRCQALQCWRAVQIGQNRKRMQGTQEAPE